MGIQAKIRDKLRKQMVTKIHGQPGSHDITIPKKNFIPILASIPAALRGRNHGHAGILMELAACSNMTDRTDFANPANPGIYLTGLAANAAIGTRARAEAEHKELINQFETFKESAKARKTSSSKQSTMEILSKLNSRH
jgi:hypothetical protein